MLIRDRYKITVRIYAMLYSMKWFRMRSQNVRICTSCHGCDLNANEHERGKHSMVRKE